MKTLIKVSLQSASEYFFQVSLKAGIQTSQVCKKRQPRNKCSFFYSFCEKKKKALVNLNEKLTPSRGMALIFHLNDRKNSTFWFNGSSSLIPAE